MATQENSIIVRLVIFSGRPDPEWTLDEDAISQLREQVGASLQADQIKEAPLGGLGYRGFLIRNSAKVADIPNEFIVYRGVLTIHSDTGEHHRRDTGKVETFLIENARSRGYGELLDAVGLK